VKPKRLAAARPDGENVFLREASFSRAVGFGRLFAARTIFSNTAPLGVQVSASLDSVENQRISCTELGEQRNEACLSFLPEGVLLADLLKREVCLEVGIGTWLCVSARKVGAAFGSCFGQERSGLQCRDRRSRHLRPSCGSASRFTVFRRIRKGDEGHN
jgi:hypothetical protein